MLGIDIKCIVCRVEAMLAVLDHFDIQFARAGLGEAMDLASQASGRRRWCEPIPVRVPPTPKVEALVRF